MKIVLPWPHKSLSPNARTHHMALAAEKRRARIAAFWIASEAMPRGYVAPSSPHVSLTFFPPDNRLRDLDNMLSSMKAALDGVAEAIRVDDSAWSMSIRRGERVKDGCVVVTVTDGIHALDYADLHAKIIPKNGVIS